MRSALLYVLTAVVAGCASTPVTNPPPTAEILSPHNDPVKKDPDAVPIIIAQDAKLYFSPHGEYVSLLCQFNNPTEMVVHYVGYTATSFDPPLSAGRIAPQYKFMYKRDDEWRLLQCGWCGVGMARLSLEPGASAIFSVALPDSALDWEATKIGFECSWVNHQGQDVSETIWSNEAVACP